MDRRDAIKNASGLGLALVAEATLGRPAEDGPAKKMASVSPLNRTALLVADVDVSSEFYSEVLGLEMFSTERAIPAPILPQLVRLLGGPPSGVTRYRFFRSGASTSGWVALFEVKPPPPAIHISRLDQMNIGEACLVFFHPDLDTLIPRMKAHGAIIIGGPEKLVVGRGDQREIIVRNREGTLFNFIEKGQ
jgi:catechol 2,3-dioxygenase-like lactoylglutathione lyase family enzyme